MLAKRIIPCLDVTGGRVVKGVNFVELRDAGDPVEIAARYNEQGADELTFLDITATSDGARRHPAHHRSGGLAGLHSADRGRRRAHGGTTCAACSTPAPTRSASTRRRWPTRRSSARRPTSTARSASSWPSTPSGAAAPTWPRAAPAGTSTPTAAARTPAWTRWPGPRRWPNWGAGEILLTSMDRDGTKIGFDLELTRAVSDAVPVPVIASGGVGTLQHLADGIRIGGADAVLAASIFHYGEFTVGQAKALLAREGIRGAPVTSGAACTRSAHHRRQLEAQQAAGGRQARAAPHARPRARNAVQLARPGLERLALPGCFRRQRRTGLRGGFARCRTGGAAGSRPHARTQPSGDAGQAGRRRGQGRVRRRDRLAGARASRQLRPGVHRPALRHRPGCPARCRPRCA